jgi:hypothetical protein
LDFLFVQLSHIAKIAYAPSIKEKKKKKKETIPFEFGYDNVNLIVRIVLNMAIYKGRKINI